MVRFSHCSESYKLAVLRRNCKRELDSGREKAGRDEENLKKKVIEAYYIYILGLIHEPHLCSYNSGILSGFADEFLFLSLKFYA